MGSRSGRQRQRQPTPAEALDAIAANIYRDYGIDPVHFISDGKSALLGYQRPDGTRVSLTQHPDEWHLVVVDPAGQVIDDQRGRGTPARSFVAGQRLDLLLRPPAPRARPLTITPSLPIVTKLTGTLFAVAAFVVVKALAIAAGTDGSWSGARLPVVQAILGTMDLGTLPAAVFGAFVRDPFLGLVVVLSLTITLIGSSMPSLVRSIDVMHWRIGILFLVACAAGSLAFAVAPSWWHRAGLASALVILLWASFPLWTAEWRLRRWQRTARDVQLRNRQVPKPLNLAVADQERVADTVVTASSLALQALDRKKARWGRSRRFNEAFSAAAEAAAELRARRRSADSRRVIRAKRRSAQIWDVRMNIVQFVVLVCPLITGLGLATSPTPWVPEQCARIAAGTAVGFYEFPGSPSVRVRSNDRTLLQPSDLGTGVPDYGRC